MKFGPRGVDALNTPPRERLSTFIGHRDGIAGFGSLPVLGRTPRRSGAAISAYAAAFRARTEALLADRPIDFQKLKQSIDQAIDDIRRPRLIAYLSERLETAWNGARYEAFLDAVTRLRELGSPLDDPERIAMAEARRRPPMTLGEENLDETSRIWREPGWMRFVHRSSPPTTQPHPICAASKASTASSGCRRRRRYGLSHLRRVLSRLVGLEAQTHSRTDDGEDSGDRVEGIGLGILGP